MFVIDETRRQETYAAESCRMWLNYRCKPKAIHQNGCSSVVSYSATFFINLSSLRMETVSHADVAAGRPLKTYFWGALLLKQEPIIHFGLGAVATITAHVIII